MQSIVNTLNSYKSQAKELAMGTLDIARIRRCSEAISITKIWRKIRQSGSE